MLHNSRTHVQESMQNLSLVTDNKTLGDNMQITSEPKAFQPLIIQNSHSTVMGSWCKNNQTPIYCTSTGKDYKVQTSHLNTSVPNN